MNDIGVNEKTPISVIITYLLVALVGAIVGGAVMFALTKGTKRETAQPIPQQTAQPVDRYAPSALPEDSKYIE